MSRSICEYPAAPVTPAAPEAHPEDGVHTPGRLRRSTSREIGNVFFDFFVETKIDLVFLLGPSHSTGASPKSSEPSTQPSPHRHAPSTAPRNAPRKSPIKFKRFRDTLRDTLRETLRETSENSPKTFSINNRFLSLNLFHIVHQRNNLTFKT